MKKLILKICFACNLIAIVCLPFLWSITCYAAEDAPKKTELSSIATIIGGILWLIVGIIITIMRLKNTVFFGTREGISNAKFSVLLTSFVIAGIIVAPIIIVINWLVNIIIGILKILVIAIVVIVVIAVVLCIIGFVLSKISSTGKNANVENDPDENITNSTNVMPVEVSDSSNIPSSDPDKEKASSEIVRDIDNSVQIKSKIKLCPKCGQELNNEFKFCAFCGYNFDEKSVPIHQTNNMPDYPTEKAKLERAQRECDSLAENCMIFGIFSVPLVIFLIGGLVAILSVTYGIKALKGKTRKKKAVVIGLCLDGISIIISITVLIMLLFSSVKSHNTDVANENVQVESDEQISNEVDMDRENDDYDLQSETSSDITPATTTIKTTTTESKDIQTTTTQVQDDYNELDLSEFVGEWSDATCSTYASITNNNGKLYIVISSVMDMGREQWSWEYDDCEVMDGEGIEARGTYMYSSYDDEIGDWAIIDHYQTVALMSINNGVLSWYDDASQWSDEFYRQ